LTCHPSRNQDEGNRSQGVPTHARNRCFAFDSICVSEIQEDSGTDAHAMSYPILSAYSVEREDSPEHSLGGCTCLKDKDKGTGKASESVLVLRQDSRSAGDRECYQDSLHSFGSQFKDR